MTHARFSDPWTSHEAAASIDQVITKDLQKCIHMILSFKPMIDEELVDAYQAQVDMGHIRQVSPQAIRTARNELYKMKHIYVSGVKKTRSGNQARVWSVNLGL